MTEKTNDNKIHEFKLKQYEQLLKDIHHNSNICWTINSIFITAAFTLTAYLFTADDPPNKFYLILSILSLLWFSMFYNAGYSKINHKKYKLIKQIFEGDKINEGDNGYKYLTIDKSPIRNIYFLNLFVFVYHLIFIIYSYEKISWRCWYILLFSFIGLIFVIIDYERIETESVVEKVFKSFFKKFCIFHWKELGLVVTLPFVIVLIIYTHYLWQILYLESYGIILQPISLFVLLGIIWKSKFLNVFRPRVDVLIGKAEVFWGGSEPDTLKENKEFMDVFNTPILIIYFHNIDDYCDIERAIVKWWLVDKENNETFESMLSPEIHGEPILDLPKHGGVMFHTFFRRPHGKFLYHSEHYHLIVELHDKYGKIKTKKALEAKVKWVSVSNTPFPIKPEKRQ